MKSGGSTLNPHAASYVPLMRRGFADANREFNTGTESVPYGHQPVNTSPRGQHHNVPQGYAHRGGPIQTAEFPQRKDHHGSEFVASTSHHPNQMPKKSYANLDIEMDLAYLQMLFPGISDESLADVYLANRFDVDAAIDMLSQLEIYPDENKLPDTLDIGDVPEPGSSSHNAEAGTSSSG